VAQLGGAAVGPDDQTVVVDQGAPDPEPAGDDRERRQVAPAAERLLGQGEGAAVVVDHDGVDAGRGPQQVGQGHVGPAEGGREPDHAGPGVDVAARGDAEAGDAGPQLGMVGEDPVDQAGDRLDHRRDRDRPLVLVAGGQLHPPVGALDHLAVEVDGQPAQRLPADVDPDPAGGGRL